MSDECRKEAVSCKLQAAREQPEESCWPLAIGEQPSEESFEPGNSNK